MNPTLRILVADDEPTILILLKKILTTEGYEVTIASNGDEALHLSRTQWFDLFLIDLIMPGRDGIETILTLRSFRKNAPVIAMSGGWHDGSRSCLELAGKLGACSTLAKPFDRNSLIAAIESIMEAVPRKSKNEFVNNSNGVTAFKELATCAF